MTRKEENHRKIAWLNKYLAAVREEQMILDEIQRLREDKMFPSLIMDGMPHGSSQSDLSAYAAKLDAQMTKLKKWRDERVRTYNNILDRIHRVEDDNQRALLICRYIKGMRWEDVASKLGYTWSWTHKLHSKALEAIEI